MVKVFVDVFVGVGLSVFVPVVVLVTVGVSVMVGVLDGVLVAVFVNVGVREKVKVEVAVEVEVLVGVGLQAARAVVTAFEKTLFMGVLPSSSPVFTSDKPQLLMIPTTVKAPLAPAARVPSGQTTCWPVTVGELLADE